MNTIYEKFKKCFQRDNNLIYNAWIFDDNCAFPKEKYIPIIRQNFGINDFNEKILFVHDNGYGHTFLEGLAITDKGFYGLDKEDPEVSFMSWGGFNNVKYIDGELCLFVDDSVTGSIPISYFVCSSFQKRHARKYGESIAALLSSVADFAFRQQESQYESFANKYDNIEDDEEKIKLALKTIESLPEGSFELAMTYITLGNLFYAKDEHLNAISYYVKAISSDAIEEGSELYGEICLHMYLSYAELENYTEARRWSAEAAIYSNEKERLEVDSEHVTYREAATRDFYQYDEIYTQNFLSLPYNERKTLLIVDDVYDLKQTSYVTLRLGSDLSHLSFPTGHPKADTLYVAHPKVANRYVPMESYQLEFAEDRVREFCELAQSLGALRIDISVEKGIINEKESRTVKSAGVGVSYKGYGVSAGKNRELGERLIEEISHHINLRQTFKPNRKPFVPDGLCWFDTEPSWQRLARQRIDGNLLSHEERIDTIHSQVITDSELHDVGVEIQALYLKLGVNRGIGYEEMFGTQEHAAIKIKVSFASVDTLTAEEVTKTGNKVTKAPAEVEENEESPELVYLKELKKLKHLQAQLGISDARAAELRKLLEL